MFYASINTGLMLGPAIAAGLLLVTTAPVVLVLNAVSFVVPPSCSVASTSVRGRGRGAMSMRWRYGGRRATSGLGLG